MTPDGRTRPGAAPHPAGSPADSDRPPPQVWRTSRRRHWPGVLVMLGLMGLILGYFYVRWVGAQDFKDVLISTWSCEQELADDAGIEHIEAAGCVPQAVESEVFIMQGSRPLTVERTVRGPGTEFADVPTSSIELALRFEVTDPAASVFLTDTSTGAPRPLRALNPDSSGTLWTQHFDPGDSDRFGLLVTPRP